MRCEAFATHATSGINHVTARFQPLHEPTRGSANDNGEKACMSESIIEIIRAQNTEFALFLTVFPDKN